MAFGSVRLPSYEVGFGGWEGKLGVELTEHICKHHLAVPLKGFISEIFRGTGSGVAPEPSWCVSEDSDVLRVTHPLWRVSGPSAEGERRGQRPAPGCRRSSSLRCAPSGLSSGQWASWSHVALSIEKGGMESFVDYKETQKYFFLSRCSFLWTTGCWDHL